MSELDEFLEKSKNGGVGVYIMTPSGLFSGNVKAHNTEVLRLEPAFFHTNNGNSKIEFLIISKESVVGYGK